MGHRPTALLLGATALVAVLNMAEAASSQPANHSVVRADVAATGQALDPADGWVVEHLAEGVYRIALADEQVSIDIPSWDAVADVAVLPQGDGTNVVRFTHGATPVDTAFTFVAVARR